MGRLDDGMTETFADLMFTKAVRAEQQARGSAEHYAKPYRQLAIGQDEAAFIQSRTSFYMASVNSDGWPYVQHRGGPAGFLRVVDEATLAFADYPGNRQYVTTGNLAGESRVSLFLMDYPRRARLKILARAEVLAPEAVPDLAQSLAAPEGAPPQSVLRLRVAALDWNCPKYITPRYSEAEISEMLGPEHAPHDSADRRIGSRVGAA